MGRKKDPEKRIWADKIYLVSFIKPNYYSIYKINSLFFKNNKSYNTAYYILKSENYFEKFIGKRDAFKKGRQEKLLYGKVDPIIDRIKSMVPLNSFDEYVIRDKLSSNFFRFLLDQRLPYLLQKTSLNPIDEIVEVFDTLLLAISRVPNFQFLVDIDTLDGYEDEKKNIAKDIDSIPFKIPQSTYFFSVGDVKDFFDFWLFPKVVLTKVNGKLPLGKDIIEKEAILKELDGLNSSLQSTLKK